MANSEVEGHLMKGGLTYVVLETALCLHGLFALIQVWPALWEAPSSYIIVVSQAPLYN